MSLWIRDHSPLSWFIVVSVSLVMSYALRDGGSGVYHMITFVFLYSLCMMIKGIWSGRESDPDQIGRLLSLQGKHPSADKAILYCRNKGRFPAGIVSYALSKSS